MDPLWAPWRMEFILKGREKDCFLCRYLAEDPARDRENLVLWRGENVFVVLNRYPYSNGHLMVVPNRHTADLAELDGRTAAEMWDALGRMVRLLTAVLRTEGTNVGLNLGRAAGAGVDDHLHLHVVPRWVGDTNFMPVLSGTKVISQSLSACYDALARRLAEPT
ncbi:MAG: HIT domain-containing protein [Planctomycetes bacterium]|nr:HIT domain-containing protein [Planctomycetota bacterium]